MLKDASFDPTGVYRYVLGRAWEPEEPLAVFVMLNPSAADSQRDDPTIRRCIRLAQSWGYGRLRVVNLFAFRTAYPSVLSTVPDPVGPENDRYLAQAADQADLVVVAWGNAGRLHVRDQKIAPLFPNAHCLGLTQSGSPRRPLYVPRDTRPSPPTPRYNAAASPSSHDFPTALAPRARIRRQKKRPAHV